MRFQGSDFVRAKWTGTMAKRRVRRRRVKMEAMKESQLGTVVKVNQNSEKAFRKSEKKSW